MKKRKLKIPKMNKCIGCTMICQQSMHEYDNEQACKDKGYKDYDSAEGFSSKEEAWKYYSKLRKDYYTKKLSTKKST